MAQMQAYDQPTSTPVPKVAAVGAAGTIITAIVAILAFMGVIVPQDVTNAAQNGIAALVVVISALQTIVVFLAGYLKKDVKPTSAVPIIQESK